MKTKKTDEQKKAVPAEDAQQIEANAISSAWPSFEAKLAAVLEKMEEDQFLIICKKDVNEFVQFSVQQTCYRIETTSNWYRDENNQLSESDTAHLLELGFNPPTNKPEDCSPEVDKTGSPNFYLEFPLPLDVGSLAALTVRTLTEILSVSHPAQLEYSAFDSEGDSILLPELSLKLRIDSGIPAPDLRERLLETVIALTGIQDWSYDEDGDLGGIRFKNAVVFVRVDEDQPCLHIHSCLIDHVEETPALLARVNEFNSLNGGYMSLFVKYNAVYACANIYVCPFVASIVAHCLGAFCQVADKLFVRFKAEFGEDDIGEDATVTEQLSHVVH